jgi:hypothetical protein
MLFWGYIFNKEIKNVLKSKTECTVVCFLEKGKEYRPQTVISSQLQKKQKCLSVLTLRSVFHAFFSFYCDPVFPPFQCSQEYARLEFLNCAEKEF